MGIITVVDGGEATDEEVRAWQAGQERNEAQQGLSAAQLQPKSLTPSVGSDGMVKLPVEALVPEVLRTGESASAEDVVKMAMDNSADHFDLIGECRKVMVMYGADERQIKAFLTNPMVHQSVGRSAYAQRAALNSFWSVEIGRMGAAGMRYRQHLVNEGSALNWLEHFCNGPVQFIVQFALPVGDAGVGKAGKAVKMPGIFLKPQPA